MTLTEFLLARIAEDEAVADLAAEYEGSGTWDYLDPPSAVHQSRHDPVRVLAECAAKRWLVEYVAGVDLPSTDVVLSIMATSHASHPDYREEWKP